MHMHGRSVHQTKPLGFPFLTGPEFILELTHLHRVLLLERARFLFHFFNFSGQLLDIVVLFLFNQFQVKVGISQFY